MRTVYPVKYIKGSISLPGDKSISHRALILAAMAKSESRLKGVPKSSDCQATRRVLKQLGIQLEERRNGEIRIYGTGLRGFKEPNVVLNTGNSGTLARLISGVLSGQRFFSVLTGDASLKSRPMDRIVKPLEKMGAKIYGRLNGERLPLAIQGCNLHGTTHELLIASAQVKSALLFAGLLADGFTRIKEPAVSRDHTERLLKSIGVPIKVGDLWCEITSPPEWEGIDYKIPGDLSNAAPFIIAALLLKGSHLYIKNIGLNPIRIKYLEVLRRMGGCISWEVEGNDLGEPWGKIEVMGSSLYATHIREEEIPAIIDEVPLLALIASQAEGETTFSGIGELKTKESNRLDGIMKGLSLIGVKPFLSEDNLIVKGKLPIKGVKFPIKDSIGLTHKDHRMVMWYAVAGLIGNEPVTIKGEKWVYTSFPDFWNILDKVVKC